MRGLAVTLLFGLSLLAAAIWSHGENRRYIHLKDDLGDSVFDTKTGSTYELRYLKDRTVRFETNPVSDRPKP